MKELLTRLVFIGLRYGVTIAAAKGVDISWIVEDQYVNTAVNWLLMYGPVAYAWVREMRNRRVVKTMETHRVSEATAKVVIKDGDGESAWKEAKSARKEEK